MSKTPYLTLPSSPTLPHSPSLLRPPGFKFTDESGDYAELHRRLVKGKDLPQFEPVTATLDMLVAEGERLVMEQVRVCVGGGACGRGNGTEGAVWGLARRSGPPGQCRQDRARNPSPRPLQPSLPLTPPTPQDAVNANKLSEEYLRFLHEAKKRKGAGIGLKEDFAYE